MAVAAKGEVRASGGFEEADPSRQAYRVDSSSRASQALVQILATKHSSIRPEYVQTAQTLPNAEDADAALVISDPALRVSLKMKALSVKIATATILLKAIQKTCRYRGSRRFSFTMWPSSGAK